MNRIFMSHDESVIIIQSLYLIIHTLFLFQSKQGLGTGIVGKRSLHKLRLVNAQKIFFPDFLKVVASFFILMIL